MSLTVPNSRLPAIIGAASLSIPGLALFAAILGLLLRPTLFDPDYYWHIETGRLIVAQGGLPTTDPFSFTNAGRDWVLHEWLFQVVLYGAFAAFGSFGVKLLSALMGGTALALVYAATKKVLQRPTPALWLTGIAYICLFPSPRPQLVTYIGVGAYLYVLASLKYGNSARLLPALPLIMVLWVNAHGGYPIGVVLVALFCASEWLNLRIDGRGERRSPHLKRLALMLGLTVLASLCNPYFVAHWAYPFEVMGMAANRDISEWRSPDFHALDGKLFLLMVAGFCLLQIYRRRKPDLTEIAVPGLLIVAAFSASRHAFLAAMAMSLFAAAALSDGIAIAPRVSAGVERLRAQWQRRAARGKQLGRAEGALNLAIAAALGLAAAAFYPIASAAETAKIEKYLPVGATQFMIEKGIAGRMFNTYHFGGYLIHALYPRERVFIDGRADMYGDAFFKAYLDIDRGRPNWDRLIDEYRIDLVLTTPGAPIRQLLLTRGDFRLVYEDEASALLVKNTPAFATIPGIAGR